MLPDEIDPQNHVAGWPKLKAISEIVSVDEMHRRCGAVSGCSAFNFAEKTCEVIVTDPDGWVVEHEYKHCEGYDHYGSNKMKDELKEWNNKRKE